MIKKKTKQKEKRKLEKPNETTKDENNENKGENGGGSKYTPNSYCLFTPKENSGPLNYTIFSLSAKKVLKLKLMID